MRLLFVILVLAAMALPLEAQEIVMDSVLLTVAEQAEVAAREEGVLTELNVREGQIVRAGEVLARLDDADAKLAYDRALIEVERAKKLAANDIKLRLGKKEIEIAESELRRATEASDRLNRSVTEAELDRLKIDVQRAMLQVEQAQFDAEAARLVVRFQENQLRSADEQLQRRQLVSPISGTVVSLDRHLGEFLKVGQTVARIIATNRLRAEGFLNADKLVLDLVGRKVDLSVRLPAVKSERFSGSIVFVHPEVDPVNGQVRIWAQIENPDGRLRPGMSGSMSILP